MSAEATDSSDDSSSPTAVVPLPAIESLEVLAAALRRVLKDGERVTIEQEGQPVAALISIKDLRFYEKLFEEEEDRIDNAACDKILEDLKAGRTKTIPWEQVEAELDQLKD